MDVSSAHRLIAALHDPALFDHRVDGFQVHETHSAWVLLTGPYAYKVKKPVDLGFLDFSTLNKRRHYCEQELRLNQRLAPQLYLEVVPITGSSDQPQLGGSGQAIEYAVKMVQFASDARLDQALERGTLQATHIDGLAGQLAEFHQQAKVSGTRSPYGAPEQVWQPVAANFETIEPLLQDPTEQERLSGLRRWIQRQHKALLTHFQERKQSGYIRECHGDLHTGNMALLDDEIVVFDCIEFNEALRWIDVMNEMAFITMDLVSRGYAPWTYRLLNGYLERTGDYEGLAVLGYYQVYRALVRAKVACIRSQQEDADDPDRQALAAEYSHYVDLAQTFTEPTPASLIITHGLSGSGKTTVSSELVETHGAVRVRSDIERKRLFGLPPEARSDSSIASGLYSPEATERTYEFLVQRARTILHAGYPVIVDAAFLKHHQRAMFRDLAQALGVPFIIFHCAAPEALLRERVSRRAQTGADASEAGIDVLAHQLSSYDPVQAAEADQVITVYANHADG